jgi:hypothetical protein
MRGLQLVLEGSALSGRVALCPPRFVVDDAQKVLARCPR